MGYTPMSIIKEDLSEVTSTASMDKSRESQEAKIPPEFPQPGHLIRGFGHEKGRECLVNLGSVL